MAYEDVIKETFGTEPTEESRLFASTLRTNWTDLAHGMSRRTTLLFLFVGLFELLTRAEVAEFSVGPLRLERFTFVELWIPIIFAYLVFEQVLATMDYDDYENISIAIAATYYPRLESEGWNTLLAPPLPILWSTRISQMRILSAANSVRVYFGLLVTVLVWLASALFPVYAIYRLFKVLPAEDNILIWISLILTAAFTCASITYFLLEVFSNDD